MSESAHPETGARLPAWMTILSVIMVIAVIGMAIGLPSYRQYCAIEHFNSTTSLQCCGSTQPSIELE